LRLAAPPGASLIPNCKLAGQPAGSAGKLSALADPPPLSLDSAKNTNAVRAVNRAQVRTSSFTIVLQMPSRSDSHITNVGAVCALHSDEGGVGGFPRGQLLAQGMQPREHYPLLRTGTLKNLGAAHRTQRIQLHSSMVAASAG
jgi:hypothetical protein